MSILNIKNNVNTYNVHTWTSPSLCNQQTTFEEEAFKLNHNNIYSIQMLLSLQYKNYHQTTECQTHGLLTSFCGAFVSFNQSPTVMDQHWYYKWKQWFMWATCWALLPTHLEFIVTAIACQNYTKFPAQEHLIISNNDWPLLEPQVAVCLSWIWTRSVKLNLLCLA